MFRAVWQVQVGAEESGSLEKVLIQPEEPRLEMPVEQIRPGKAVILAACFF